MWTRERYRISPPRFLAQRCKRRLNQGSFVLSYFALVLWVTFGLCIFLYCFVCQYQSSDWLCVSVSQYNCKPGCALHVAVLVIVGVLVWWWPHCTYWVLTIITETLIPKCLLIMKIPRQFWTHAMCAYEETDDSRDSACSKIFAFVNKSRPLHSVIPSVTTLSTVTLDRKLKPCPC